VPITNGAGFEIQSSNGLNITCTSCTAPQGMISGGFGGAGAAGAVVLYGFQPNPAGSTNIVTGVAAFRR
jgi:hypothetical protein